MYAGAHINLHSGQSLKSSVADRELGIVPTEIELQMMIEEIDTDNSGDIDMHEFVSAISVADCLCPKLQLVRLAHRSLHSRRGFDSQRWSTLRARITFVRHFPCLTMMAAARWSTKSFMM